TRNEDELQSEFRADRQRVRRALLQQVRRSRRGDARDRYGGPLRSGQLLPDLRGGSDARSSGHSREIRSTFCLMLLQDTSFLQTLPFQRIQRAITKSDCQPLPDGSIVVAVFGQLKTDDDPVNSYNHFFILRPNPAGSFFISNEIFRLVLHDM
ncbi:nuclear transport factor 2 (NTF-2), partial [Aphelenchoides avenae]